MSQATQMETENPNVNSKNPTPEATPLFPQEAAVNPAIVKFRDEFYTDQKAGVLFSLGEDPQEFQQMMESLLVEFDPRPGIELQIVEQIAQMFWRMRRAQRMQDGMAMKQIQYRLDLERLTAAEKASRAFEQMEPFLLLQAALGRRVVGPTSAEIDAFVKTQTDKSSPEMLEFILLLKSLRRPIEEKERKAALRKARAHLRGLMDTQENAAWRVTRQMERVESPENLAALMAPNDKSAALAQRMEDSSLDRIGKLISTLQKVRTGALYKKEDVENDEQSHQVYEKKQNADKMTLETSDI